MALAGKILIKKVNVKSVLIPIVAATLIHWLVSDLGGCLDQKTTDAIFTVYRLRLITAIPYELNFLVGTLIYGALMFGSFEWIQQKYQVHHV
jgi:hypothetical protein